MCEYCAIEEWQKENPPQIEPDPFWNVRFLDVVTAMTKGGDSRYVDVQIVAPSRFVAERVAWDLLREKIGRVPFKDDWVLMGSSEMHNKKDEQGWTWAAWDDHTILAQEGSGPCWHCGKETRWIEINFESWLCSPECNAAKWKEYEEASRA